MFNDPTVAMIESLDDTTAALAFQFINALRQAGIPAWISSARRDAATEARLVAAGRSKTMRSYHLTGQAFDFDVLGYGRDQLPTWWLNEVGAFGESLGLVWGGRWQSPYDPGHFQSPEPLNTAYLTA